MVQTIKAYKFSWKQTLKAYKSNMGINTKHNILKNTVYDKLPLKMTLPLKSYPSKVLPLFDQNGQRVTTRC